MRRSKRVSFHQEVTVKEFIKKQVDNSVESDISSPDLYRAPINHRGQDTDVQGSSDDSAMELTEVVSTFPDSILSDDSNMDLTDVSLPAQGELTTMINTDKRDYPKIDTSLVGESTEVVLARAVSTDDNLDLSLNTTSRGTYRDLDSLAKKMVPGLTMTNVNNSMHVSHNASSLLNESESSSVRRSVRIAKRISSEGTPQFKTPQVNLINNKKKGGSHSSRSKQKKNVSLLSSANSTASRSFSNVSKMPSIDLLENSAETSEISLVSASDSITQNQAVEKQERHTRLIQLREEKLAELERKNAEIEMWKKKVKELEEEIEVNPSTHVHPYTAELLDILEGS
jgi:hypothetical protein